MHVVVIVLGDVGRSPRMQYHALSLLRQGCEVSLVGYAGEELVPNLNARSDLTSRLNIVRFRTSSPTALRRILPIYYIWRLISLVGMLLYSLFIRVPRPVDYVLVQNPPAIPLLFISCLYCRILGLIMPENRPKLIIDWHNLGYSMLSKGLIQKLAEKYERTMAPWANGHLCVTAAMKQFLRNNMKIDDGKIRILYDCPPDMFKPLAMQKQHEFLLRIQQSLPCKWSKGLKPNQTIFTEKVDGKTLPRQNRPALVTSSTSWTEDEDFGILLDALISLDNRIEKLGLVVCVTGKGPMKEFYEEKISKLRLQHISIHTLWLEPGDYPQLLACADLGVSLHTSTSGLDLPMKILDLFGCQTPVCAHDFECIQELVQDKVNGRLFSSSEELSNQLHDLLNPLTGYVRTPEAHSFGELAKFSENLIDRPRWSENWKMHALPMFET